MANPSRLTDYWQRISFTPNLSQVFFSNDSNSCSRYEKFGKVVEGPNRLILLCLGLLNVILLIAAIAIGSNCANVRQVFLQVSHSVTAELIDELNYLHGNYSQAVKDEEEAKMALQTAIKNHEQLKQQIEEKRTLNNDQQKKMEALRMEKTNLQTNMSLLEGTCGKCPPGWKLLNSSCYFFSYNESPNDKRHWQESRDDCIHRGADLIVVNNPEEQKFVSGIIDGMKTSHNTWDDGFWLGVTDIETEGHWVWINNVTETEQRYWMEGEPNNGGQSEHCGVALSSRYNPWKTRYDGRCNRKNLHWICEKASN
ncbi:uncharacterized protein ACBR49_014339 [Aulostomus maculatus]